MEKLYTLLIAILLCSGISKAQSTATIKGQVTDSMGRFIESATVSATNSGTNKLVKMTTSGKEGNFELGPIEAGDYTITVTAIGYQMLTTKKITLTAGKDHNTGAIKVMQNNSASLQNVTVTAKKPMIEVKPDKTIVNVDAYITNAGTNALEVLEKSPGVTVDRDGNISLKGKQGVIVLVDGKQTYLSGADLANLLRNTPSNQLETVEIMSQPSAKYDASGNSGIINIRTKKGRQDGFNGTVNLSYIQGVYPKSPNSINLNFKKNKINWFTSASYSYWEGYSDLKLLRKFTNSGEELSTVFDQVSKNRFKGNNFTFRTGIDYNIDKNTTIGFQVNGIYNPRTFSANSTANIYDGKGILDSTNKAFSENKDPWKNAGANINFRRKFDTTGKELTADLDYLVYQSKSNQTSDNYTIYPGNILVDSFLLSGYLPSDINIFSGKVDYVQPLGKGGRLETGIKSSMVKTDNDAQYKLWNGEGKSWYDDTSRSNHFIYDENINAAYANYSRDLKKWSFQAGLRYEHTIANGHQLAKDESFRRNYGQFFPSAFVSYKINDKNQLTTSYGRRIERPSYQDMNPFQYFLDQYTYRQGNPNLLPQISNNFELAHNFKGVLNSSINYTLTDDIINDILKQNDSTKVTYLTKENIAKRRNIGLSVSFNQPLTKWWTISVFANIYNNHYTGIVNNEQLDASITSYMGNMNNQFKFGKTWGAELSGFYRSKSQESGLIIAEPMGVISLGFSKQILKQKGTLKLSLNDPFYIMRFRGYTQFGNIDTQINSKWDNRRIALNFSYRFGKNQQAQPPRRKTGSANEEQNRVGNGGNQQ